MSKHKIYIAISIVVIIILLGVILLIKSAFSEWGDGIIATGEKKILSELGDEFNLQYVTQNFPDITTVVTIMDYSGEKIVYLPIDGDFYESELVLIIDSEEVRCYETYRFILYRIANESFKSVDITRIDELEPNKYPLFIDVAKILTAEHEWEWIKRCAGFLLKTGDIEMRKILEQYALGQFTQEELEINMNSEFTKEEMMKFSVQLLKQE